MNAYTLFALWFVACALAIYAIAAAERIRMMRLERDLARAEARATALDLADIRSERSTR